VNGRENNVTRLIVSIGHRTRNGMGRMADVVSTGLLATVLWVTGTVTDAWRLRRTEEGGVADEAAMIAIVLAAAVLIGGIVFALIQGAGEDLELQIPSGGD
jgi:hypothetical protein